MWTDILTLPILTVVIPWFYSYTDRKLPVLTLVKCAYILNCSLGTHLNGVFTSTDISAELLLLNRFHHSHVNQRSSGVPVFHAPTLNDTRLLFEDECNHISSALITLTAHTVTSTVFTTSISADASISFTTFQLRPSLSLQLHFQLLSMPTLQMTLQTLSGLTSQHNLLHLLLLLTLQLIHLSWHWLISGLTQQTHSHLYISTRS